MNDYRFYKNSDYLAHYGILGMKWGIRRFQPYPKGYSGDGKFTGASEEPKKEHFNILKSHVRYHARNVTGAVRDFKNAKGITKKGSALFGNKRKERRHHNKSLFYKERSEGAWLQTNALKRETASHNQQYISEYYKRKQSMSLGKRFMNVFTHNEWYKTPYERIDGSVTTRGRMAVMEQLRDDPQRAYNYHQTNN